MKTLDEVIKANECCDHGEPDSRCEDCPYNGLGACCLERENDALHYLKEYRKLDSLDVIAFPEDDNPALDWGELRQMTGKPVWLESHGDIEEFTGWVIVSSVLSDRARFILSHYDDDDFLTYEMALPDCTFGKEWNVYRKERQ